ncbi:uncharacterized protein EAF01_000696 [Botrytis porri]|uniref:uncharacterized protein n=1 Tax=Botrytis porri TaxID=87229 RepID=UPI001900DE9C|nr:uncharacterized protein EAF01_000696 [Botrytis porri]KAF7914290.1 hypothetical protein EAF01_000696 [Botrytis porri]
MTAPQILSPMEMPMCLSSSLAGAWFAVLGNGGTLGSWDSRDYVMRKFGVEFICDGVPRYGHEEGSRKRLVRKRGLRVLKKSMAHLKYKFALQDGRSRYVSCYDHKKFEVGDDWEV